MHDNSPIPPGVFGISHSRPRKGFLQDELSPIDSCSADPYRRKMLCLDPDFRLPPQTPPQIQSQAHWVFFSVDVYITIHFQYHPGGTGI